MKFNIALTVASILIWQLNINLAETKLNDRPIIGVLSQEMTVSLNRYYPGHKQFIAASYVKLIEGGGARVVPVWINKTNDYYEDIMGKINGILLPGGASFFRVKNGYSEAAYKIYQIAKRMNDKGDYFPILGICLGFELLSYIDAERTEHRRLCNSQSQPLPLDFTPGFKKYRLYSLASNEILKILREEKVTSNFHYYCLTEQNLKKVRVDKNWVVLSTNKDWNGLEFISSFEHSRYPFYGTQFHPEKNMYEWSINKTITHDENATRANQYFAQFFVEEARKSSHRFESINEELRHLIFNFPKTFTSANSIYSECFLFRPEDDYPIQKVGLKELRQYDDTDEVEYQV